MEVFMGYFAVFTWGVLVGVVGTFLVVSRISNQPKK